VSHGLHPLSCGVLRHVRIAVTVALTPPTLGPAEVPSAPLCPRALNTLLVNNPGRAAAIVAALRYPLRNAQAAAHAALSGVPISRIRAEWRDLIRRYGPASTAELNINDDPRCVSVYEPEQLALADATHAQTLIAALTPSQRVQQAVAQATWLSEFGYPASAEEVLASWAHIPSLPRPA
jgi:hypothetical protein